MTDKRVNAAFQFNVMLADSPVTRKKAEQLSSAGINTTFYKHFNVDFTRRNLFRIGDKVNRRTIRTLPWYKEITKNKYDLVWFNVAALADLAELAYAVQLCRKTNTAYWLILQHGYEDFFPAAQEEMDQVIDAATSARRFIFIADKNRVSLERAIGQPLENAFHSVNAIPGSKIAEAFQLGSANPVSNSPTARFFNLGRFAPKDKAQHLLLETFAGSQWKGRDWQLNFIGVAGFGKTNLEKLIRYYGLNPEQIKITAYTDDVFTEIVKNDVLLMPSRSEGTPFAMVESMACGRPALGTPVGGIPELIEDGQTGWLSRTVALCDISDKLEEIWSQKTQWKEMGERAQKLINEKYNQEQSIIQLSLLLAGDIS
ncbi:MAG: glycosyltransferase family 4 protein [Bacteroidota bacterium]